MAVLILTGLLPSLRTSFGTLSNALNQAARGSSGSSAAVRRTIVIAEVAASVVLICGAALLFKSLAKLQQVDAGVRIDHVITMSTDLPSAAYPSPDSAARFYEAVVERLQAVPGVEQASVSQGLPLEGVQWGEYMTLPGVKEFLLVRLKLVDPRYFGTLQIPVESGRGIEDRDRAGAPPVVVINQEVARYLSRRFGMANPVGRIVGIDVPGYGPIPESLVKLQIVGVIRSERTAGLNAPPELVAYVPLAQAPRQDIKLVVRTRSDAGGGHARHSGSGAADRSQSAPGGRDDHGAGQGAEHALGEAAHLGVGSLRRRRRADGRTGTLRGSGACGDAAAPRDRHPHGVRREVRATCYRTFSATPSRCSSWGLPEDWLEPLR